MLHGFLRFPLLFLLSILIMLDSKSLTWRFLNLKVKSGNFGHQVNSDVHLQTVEQYMRPLSSGFSLFAQLIYFLFQ